MTTLLTFLTLVCGWGIVLYHINNEGRREQIRRHSEWVGDIDSALENDHKKALEKKVAEVLKSVGIETEK